MPLAMRKFSNHGTEDPMVARVAFQWLEILPWFHLSQSRQESVHETLLMKVQPRLIAAREAAMKLEEGLRAIHDDSPKAPKQEAIYALATTFLREAHLGLEAFVPVFGFLLGRKAPDRNYAGLAKWAEQWFGAKDSLFVQLRYANERCIRPLAYWQKGVAQGGRLSVTPGRTLAETAWGLAGEEQVPLKPYLESLTTAVVPFIEDAIVAALNHLPARGPIALEQIPEPERAKAAPVRYRVVTKSRDGTIVPAGKITKAGNVVPELQRLLQQGRGKPIIATKFNGEWFVASGSAMYHSPKWQNFHDFLLFYIKEILGGEWASLEFKKPRDERHLLMRWHEDVTRHSNSHLEKGRYQ